MRNVIYAVMMLVAAPQALAAGQTIQATASFSAQIVAAADNDTEITQQEKNLKRAMYDRAARECTDIMASVAISCSITGINVSTQATRNYGQPPAIYVNSSVTMEVRLK